MDVDGVRKGVDEVWKGSGTEWAVVLGSGRGRVSDAGRV